MDHKIKYKCSCGAEIEGMPEAHYDEIKEWKQKHRDCGPGEPIDDSPPQTIEDLTERTLDIIERLLNPPHYFVDGQQSEALAVALECLEEKTEALQKSKQKEMILHKQMGAARQIISILRSGLETIQEWPDMSNRNRRMKIECIFKEADEKQMELEDEE